MRKMVVIPDGTGVGIILNSHRGGLPFQPIVDISQLLSMLITRLRMSTPHIKTFSGDSLHGKTEVSFKQ